MLAGIEFDSMGVWNGIMAVWEYEIRWNESMEYRIFNGMGYVYGMEV